MTLFQLKGVSLRLDLLFPFSSENLLSRGCRAKYLLTCVPTLGVWGVVSLHRSAKWHVLQPWTLALCQNTWIFLDLSIHRNTVNAMSTVDLKLAARAVQS